LRLCFPALAGRLNEEKYNFNLIDYQEVFALGSNQVFTYFHFLRGYFGLAANKRTILTTSHKLL